MDNLFAGTPDGQAKETLIPCSEEGMVIQLMPLNHTSKPEKDAFDINIFFQDDSMPETQGLDKGYYRTFRVKDIFKPEYRQWVIGSFYHEISQYCTDYLKAKPVGFLSDRSEQCQMFLTYNYFDLTEENCTPGTLKSLSGECTFEEGREIDRLAGYPDL